MVFATNGLADQTSYDELRFGSSWESVVPFLPGFESIPEPATLALLGVGLAALARRRRAGPARPAPLSPRLFPLDSPGAGE